MPTMTFAPSTMAGRRGELSPSETAMNPSIRMSVVRRTFADLVMPGILRLFARGGHGHRSVTGAAKTESRAWPDYLPPVAPAHLRGFLRFRLDEQGDEIRHVEQARGDARDGSVSIICETLRSSSACSDNKSRSTLTAGR